jgi:hypothetical protein
MTSVSSFMLIETAFTATQWIIVGLLTTLVLDLVPRTLPLNIEG